MSLSATVSMAGLSQVITFPSIPGKLTTDAPFALTATASSGLAVSYSLSSPAGAGTLSGGTVTLAGIAGSVTVKASQSGNATFDAAQDVYRTFVVGKGAFSKIAQGSSAGHGLGIKTDGTLWGWGNNSFGQVGNDGAAEIFGPVQIGVGTNWSEVAVGADFSVGIRGGILWTWGRNNSGQLGLGDTTSRTTPVQVGSATSWARVAAGSGFVIATKSDGTLWAWGANGNGQLGLSDFGNRNAPVKIGSAATWSDVAAGSEFVLARMSNGTLWAWGLNSSNQLGDGTTTLRNVPVQIGTGTDWSKVSCGATSSYAIKTNGTLWSWGANSSYQLGLGDSTPRTAPSQLGSLTSWAMVSGGNIHAIALQTDGSLWSWGGSGNVGATALGDSGTRLSPTRIGADNDWASASGGTSFCLALKSSGSLWSAGNNQNGRLGYPAGNFRPIKSGGMRSVTQGTMATYFVLNDGTLWAVGSGYNGEGGFATFPLPVQIGSGNQWNCVTAGLNHYLVLRADGTLWAAGNGVSGQIGDGAGTTRLSLVQVGNAQWTSIATGNQHNIAIRSDGTLWGWGSNSSGQVGDETTTQRNSPVQIGTENNWAFVACGDNYSFAIKSTGSLWAWGANGSGQLGDASTTQRNAPVQVGADSTWSRVAGGLAHSHGVKTDGTLWGWGSGVSGKIGDGTSTQRTVPVKIGTETSWVTVEAYSQHSIALRSDGTAWGTGANNTGQLGTGDSGNRTSFVQLGGHNMWSLLATGSSLYTTAATADGTLWGTGNNPDYQLGSDERLNSVLEPIHPSIGTQSLEFLPVTVTAYNTPFALTASASSGLPVSYHISGPATLTNGSITVTGPGEVKLMAFQGGGRPAWHSAAATQAAVSIVPYLTLGATTGITFSSSMLNASVSAAGLATTVVFDYDTDITDGSYASSISATPSSLAGFSTQLLSASVTGLTADKLYHFRVRATNATGSSSATGSFITGPSPFRLWATSTGLNGADAGTSADADHDGVPNLLEWVANSSTSLPGIFSTPSAVVGSNIEFFYLRSLASVNGGAGFIVEWSDGLSSTGWSNAGVTQTIMSDNGTIQQMKAVMPAGVGGRRFVRLKITAP